MNRELAKKKAQSRDCHCVKGKDRDNNYDAVIDEIFDWHEKEVKNLTIHDVSNRRELLLDFADLVMINDCDLHTKEERALAVDKYLKGKL